MLIAQLTDPHIKAGRDLAYGRVDTADLFERSVAHVNDLKPRVDAVIVTGDLTDQGSPEEYATIRPMLDRLECPYFLIPGNHDDPANLRGAFADHTYLPPSGAFLHYVIEDMPLRLIGLDTTVPGRPHGELCAERLDWLEGQLCAAPDRPTFVFMHHPPFETGIGHMDAQNLANGDAFVDLVARHRQVRHVACGHVHRAINVAPGGTPMSIGPNAAHAVTLDLDPEAPSSFTVEPPAIRLFRFAQGRIVGHLSFVGVFDGPHPFFAEDGSLID